MSRSLSLQGLRVVITRPEGQSATLRTLLEYRGAHVYEVPLIRIVPAEDPLPLIRAARELRSYDWIVFSSANGVRAFFHAYRQERPEDSVPADLQIAVVGASTREALSNEGLRASAMPEEHHAEALARALVRSRGGLRGRRILIPQARIARDTLATALREAGANVEPVVAYETLPPGPVESGHFRALLRDEPIRVVTFTSSSIAHAALDALESEASALLEGVVLASIGPVTSKTLRDRGFPPTVEADPHTASGLANAIDSYFNRPAP